MKSAKPSPVDAPAHRRSQPVRQTRTNPPRTSANPARSGSGRDAAHAGPLGDQPIDIFPAITHFADTITALPKELVRHFTLLKEVDAKLFAPEEQLFKLVAAATNAPLPELRPNNDASSIAAPTSASMSAQNSSSGIAPAAQSAPSTDEPHATASGVFDPSNIPRRQLFRQTAFKIQEILVSLEEKNHVISTANEALQRQLARVEDVWPYLENEFSDEAKWGSTTHWAYPENRNGKASNTERARRDGAAAISAAAQALADEAAARSDARKQAVQAKRNQKNQHHDSDADEHTGRHKGEGSKKTHGNKARRTAAAAAAADGGVGLGISGASATNGNPPQKRRKVEKTTNGGESMDRAMSGVFGSSAPKAKTNSPRGTPAPDGGPKKRKALPSGSGQAKKKNGASGMSPSIASSPVMGSLPEPKSQVRASPVPAIIPRPASSRARQNSLQSNTENGRARAPSSASNKPNGNAPGTPDLSSTSAFPRFGNERKASKGPSAPVKIEPIAKEGDRAESTVGSTSGTAKKEGKAYEADRKSESVPPQQPQNVVTVTTKSGRASKPSTPALATFQDAARPRSSRNTDNGNGNGNGNGGKKNHKKANSVAQAIAPQVLEEDANNSSSLQGDEDEDGDIDADEPTYCYCNSVSYGEMVACDADGCEREWFHLACVGLKVAPGSKTKWYCEDCKERLKMGGKKANSR
ncbi:Transcriptional regulatory protein PHO23 [Tolypocladium ophioglossoides CBS 100239]|uniref:Chromatin modification-related protein n=1 Tax=Tolypocladium ophioglossoides (strain CBS 100239) TaxID=1163406 RepID=A0A0L0NJR2_TOLOC|nr:Transcriptional regulatory protein PHO23 [Tolypocladium ophioglossoides CBS 100239]